MLNFINLLRNNNIKISNAEILDLYNTLTFIDCDKEILKSAVQSCLIKEKQDIALFNDLFEGYFYNKQQTDFTQQFNDLLYMFTDNNKSNIDINDIANNITYSSNLENNIMKYLDNINQNYDDTLINKIKYKVINNNIDNITNKQTDILEIDFKDYKTLNDIDIKKALQRLSDKLIKTYIRKQRYDKLGYIDIKRTIMNLLEPKIIFKKRKRDKHNLILVADISGSMTDYIYYILQIIINIIHIFNDVKIFVFMEKLKELKDFDNIQEDILDIYKKSKLGYGTDYNNVLYMLDNKNIYNKNTYILIIGDGLSKNNGVSYLQNINKKVKKIYWLNPTDVNDWDKNTLLYSLYSKMYECKNLKQLVKVIEVIVGV